MENLTPEINENIDMEHVADSTMDDLQPGMIVQGEIVTIDSEYAYVNVGTKTDGRIPLHEFEEKPNIGDIIPVMLQNKRLVDGMFQFSKKSASAELHWKKFMEWYNEGHKTIMGKIKSSINKGKLVDCNGVIAFLPFSLTADLKNKNESDTEYEFNIKSIDRKKKSVVLSRKEFLDEELESRWENFTAKYKAGDIVKGEGVKYVEFGIFVRVEGLDALLHRNDMSWKKVFKQRKVLKLGKEQEFVILDINRADRRISLGLKQLAEDPWLSIHDRYKQGDRVTGKVVTITNHGAFVEIDDGIEGFVNNADLTWNKNSFSAKDVLGKGDSCEFMVLDINQADRKLTLGYKQLRANPWDTISERFPVGSVHRKKIKKIVKFGMFVELEEGIDGLVHTSDISWDDSVKSVPGTYCVGDEVEFKILDINKGDRKIACGIKHLTRSPWEEIRKKYPPRTRVEGTVSGITLFGLFVKLDNDIEGLVHISEVSRKRVENLEEHYKIGDPVSAVVLDVDVEKKRLSLSIKSFESATEKEELEKIMKGTRPSTVTLGDFVNINLENK
ncbi:MAG TPA: S1 RNA-binding domain-containing protein [Spirochaetota bacterium]|nr:S1 RNA-binding domain-containing protein [Spirochaetota bacterium]HPC40960.1 S1 RNA-binding domain-containing protein [Spirochaetota bacterium]HPL18432.1 S1 RNA-binding domain-containing protein [Spirochaetota bacterium]HQF08610.1 S1 RNA-binding domain-containing protein [Spirochaetota bacterium]HQH97325.1 S1 RNA-binding domain-containing protein [Spirochaetota bacterium]